MRRELQLSVEPPGQANPRSLRRCYGCGNYTRPFVEMDGIIRCEECARKSAGTGEGEDENGERVEGYGAIL